MSEAFLQLDPEPPTRIANKEVLVDKHQYLLGRHKKCDYRLNDPRVSAKHCLVFRNAASQKVYLKDLSSNGTFVNGILIGKDKAVALNGGERIEILQYTDGQVEED